MNTVLLSAGAFLLLLLLIVIVRERTKEKYAIKSTDIVIAIIPVVLWLFLSGKITKLEYGELKIETAFIRVSEMSIERQVEGFHSLPVDDIPAADKEGPDVVGEMIRNKTKALTFHMGHGGYNQWAVGDYLRQLNPLPFFKYIVIVDQRGHLVGLIDPRQVSSQYHDELGFFTSIVNDGDVEALSEILSFLPASAALTYETNKREALSLMEELNVSSLPVVDGNGVLVGIVERSRLTAGMLLEIAAILGE